MLNKEEECDIKYCREKVIPIQMWKQQLTQQSEQQLIYTSHALL